MQILVSSIVSLVLLLIMPPASAAAERVSEPPQSLTSQSLIIGIFPRRDPLVTVRLFKPLQAYLEEQLDMPVKLETASSFERFESSLQARRYDLVHFNQYHYIEAQRDQGYEVIAQNEEFGEKTIRGAIFVRKDSGITSLQQLKGKLILFGGGKKAMVSYVLPRFMLGQAGIEIADYQERFAKSPPDALLALNQKQADAAGAGDLVIRMPLVINKIDSSQLLMLAQSQAFSHLPWAVRGDLDGDLKLKIQQLLVGLKETLAGREVLDAARLTAINSATDSDYDELREIIESVNAEDRRP